MATLLAIKTQARQRSDMVNSQFISDSELTGFINASMKELYDLLISAGEFYFLKHQDIPLVANQSLYDLSDDFYKLLGVDLVLDTLGNGVTLKPFQFEQRNAYLFTPTWNVVGLSYLRYMIQGSQIKFVPVPPSTQNIKVWYAPKATDLVNDTDSFDGINGFEEFIVVDCAIKMLTKEESDPSVFMAQKREMVDRINQMKVMRDMAAPSRIGDVSRQAPWEFWSFTNIS